MNTQDFNNLQNAQDWETSDEKTAFLCDLTGISVNAHGFDAFQDCMELTWENTLADHAERETFTTANPA